MHLSPASTPPAETRPAIAAVELARRVRLKANGLDADELAHWLVDARLATIEAGLLRPTAAALELGAGLEQLGD